MKTAITYQGRNLYGFHVFTAICAGSLRTYRAAGYTLREARSNARRYFAALA